MILKLGKKLYELHVGFENVKPYVLKRVEKKTNTNKTRLLLKKPKESDNSIKLSKILIDNQTTLEEIPNEALEYKFSSKCALEWILEFYKESKNMIGDKSSNDPKIREKFNTYKFADYKEVVIELLQKVTAVSVETMKLRTELRKMPWGKQPKLNLDPPKKKKTISKKPKRKNKTKKPKKTTGLQN